MQVGSFLQQVLLSPLCAFPRPALLRLLLRAAWILPGGLTEGAWDRCAALLVAVGSGMDVLLQAGGGAEAALHSRCQSEPCLQDTALWCSPGAEVGGLEGTHSARQGVGMGGEPGPALGVHLLAVTNASVPIPTSSIGSKPTESTGAPPGRSGPFPGAVGILSLLQTGHYMGVEHSALRAASL